MAKRLTFKKKTFKTGDSSKKESSLKFPSISRFIPETVNENYIFIVVLLFILISSTIVSFDLYQNVAFERKLVGETSDLQRRLEFWENEVKIHPDYRDAYFNLALISYQLKDFDSSINNLQKALEIDPNFEKGKKFQEILSK